MDLERGRYASAIEHLHEARARLQGYWLVEQHLAEAHALNGDTAQAEALLLEILAKGERPEVLDALAEIQLARGDEQDAAALVKRATECHEARLARLAGAAYGHAIEHFLEHGDDPQRTLRMAVDNHAVQPNAEAKALLARACLAAGDPRRAEQVIEEALQTPWSTVDYHLTAAEIFDARGNEPRARQQRLRADAINPRLATELDAPVPWQGTAFD
jgi:tetratricopeptide (TPR) repeat protein